MSALQQAIARLSPGYFALVMSTGIVAIGFYQLELTAVARPLIIIAAISYVVLWVLYIWRAVAHREHMLADLRDPGQAFSFFTIVAGTDVLGVALVKEGQVGIAAALFVLSATLWFVFGYVLPWQVFMTRDGKPILSRTNGTWFVWAVASQSLAVGMTQIRPHFDAAADWIGMVAVLAWSVGVALYAAIALMVLLRIIHYGITPEQFEPPYWVAMGAMAIAVVAGSNIVDMQPTPMVDAARALIAGTVVVFWSFSAWLIPMLVGAGAWRHGLRRVPLRYEASLWSMVFPIGMFGMASLAMGKVNRLPDVEVIGDVSMYVALAVWALVFIAMLRSLVLLLWGARRPADSEAASKPPRRVTQ